MRIPGLALLSLVLGFGAVLGSASCGPTCPGNEPNCGTSVGSIAGAAGTAGTTSTASCALTTAIETCFNAYCATASNAVCNCWKKVPHFDTDTTTCACTTYDPQAICSTAQANGVDASSFDCAAQTSAKSSICVPVQ